MNKPKKEKIHYPKSNEDKDRTGSATVVMEYSGIFRASKGGKKYAGYITNPKVIQNLKSKTKTPFQLKQYIEGGPDVKLTEAAEVKAKREEQEARDKKANK